MVEKLDGTRETVNRAYLVFVALDENEKPTPVPPFTPETDEEKAEYAMAHDKGQYLGVLLTTWCSCEDFMDVVEGKGVTRHKSDSKSAKTLEALRGNFRYIFPKATSRN